MYLQDKTAETFKVTLTIKKAIKGLILKLISGNLFLYKLRICLKNSFILVVVIFTGCNE